jgi:hypothetical protein
VVQALGSLIRPCKFHAKKFWAPGPCVGGDANTLGAMKLAQTILYVQDVEQAAAF